MNFTYDASAEKNVLVYDKHYLGVTKFSMIFYR